MDTWSNPDTWFDKKVKVFFICPVTWECCADNIKVPMTRDWVINHGPAIRLGLICLQYACAMGYLAGLPIPKVDDVADKLS